MKIHNLSVYIESPTEVSGKPERRQFRNQFDSHGAIVSLERLNGESNQDYKDRILDVSVHPGSPLYDGVVNNLTRAFGEKRLRAIEISLNTDVSGNYIAENPRVDLLANKVVLYSDWQPNGTAIIDKSINIYNPTDEGYFLEDLVSEINSSTCFSASVYSGVRENLHSTNLIRNSSYKRIRGDLVESNNRFSLTSNNIVQSSMFFDEQDVFAVEVTGTPSASGEYNVDYTNGVVEVYSVPSGTAGVSYHYNIFPLVVDYSYIKIYTLQDDNFTRELYNLEQVNGQEVKALPNTEGSEIIHQLYIETKHLWGE